MKFSKICEVCGEPYSTSYRQSKTCCDKCKRTRHIKKVRQWQVDNKDYWNQYQRDRTVENAKKEK